MNVLFVHAHFDDFEFTAAGTFELWRRSRPGDVKRRVLICTDGAAGHHLMSREETASRRFAEQTAAARLGEFQFRLLRDGAGNAFREGRLHLTPGFLPALWREIREFEPDLLFCPPIPKDPLAGVHVDHLDLAQAIRSVAYLINVPHAFTPEYPSPAPSIATPGSEPPRHLRTPVILNTYDGYMAGSHGHDLAVDVTTVADVVADLAWCHESQFREWLPWVDRHHLVAPTDPASWRKQCLDVLRRRKRVLGIECEGIFEVFNVTAWGSVPTLERLVEDLPGVSPKASNLAALGRRLEAWRAAAGE